MLLLTLSPVLLAVSQAQTPPVGEASQEPVPKTLAEQCPSGFAEPDTYKYLTKEPVMSYPSEALRKGIEGQVGIQLLVGCDGVVKECSILSSSGHRMLDERACQIMGRVAFNPPRNENGEASEGLYNTSLTFSL